MADRETDEARAELRVFDLSRVSVVVVLATAHRIQAPNGTADAAALIVNAEGRLFRVSFDAPDLGGFTAVRG